MKSVGLAIIVKNGAATLGACLDSVQGLFDQTVVVDTGSTDKSVEIALAHGAESHRFDWVDDFSAARNYSFDQLKTEWAFWLDADDVLVGREYVEEMVAKCEAQQLDGVILEYLYSFSEEGRESLEREWLPRWQQHAVGSDTLLAWAKGVCNTTQYRERLVRNDPAWRWVYPIHEALPASGKRLGKFDKVKVVHRRHVQPGLATPGRNLSYLLKVPVEQRDERIWFYFGLEYGHSGKFEESIQAFQTYLPLSTVPDERYLALCFLGDLHRFVKKPDEALRYYLQALGMRPTWRTAYIGLLETYAEQRQWPEAVYYGAQIERAEMPDTPFAYNPLHHAVSWINHYVLALVETQQHEEAMVVLTRARALAPTDPMFRFNEDAVAVMLNQFHGIQSVADALEYLVRTDHCEVAALLLGRLGPEFKAHPGIRRTVAQVGSICGPAARGDVVADPMKIDPDLDRSGLSTTDRWWLDPRMHALKTVLGLTHSVSSALVVGAPDSVAHLLADLGVKRLVRMAALNRWEEAAGHGPFQLGLLWNALERVREPNWLVEQTRAALTPGGSLVACVGNGPSTKGVGIPTHPRLRAYSVDAFRQVMGTMQMPTVLEGWAAEAGDLWLHLPQPVPPGRPRSIAIVCPLSPEPWGPHSLGQGIGGSEEAVIRLSRAFARRGHTVTVYGAGFVGVDEGPDMGPVRAYVPSGATIAYQPISRYHPADILLGWRYPEIFTGPRPFEAEWKALWMHDSLARERVESCLPVVDAAWAISQYHAGLYRGLPKIYEGRNGIDPWEFEQAEAAVERKDPHRCVFISTAFRGLDVLLAMWPEILRRVPTASLHCYYGWEAADKMGVTAPGTQGAEFKRQVMAEIERLGVHWHGRVGQDVLYREVIRAGVWTYPSTWAEEHCCHPDTLISVPGDHRGGPPRVRIADLEGQSGFPVWTYDEQEHRFKVGTAVRVWQAKIAEEMVAVELDDGSVLRLTPEHLVMTRDEDWVEAGDLRVGQRLMALHHRYNVMIKDSDGDWKPEHRLVGEWLAGRKLVAGEVVDHTDLMRLDNRPAALTLMSHAEHSAKTKKTITYGKRAIEKRVAFWRARWESDPKWRAERTAYLRGRGIDLWAWVNGLPEAERLAWLAKRSHKKRQTLSQKNHKVISVTKILGGPVYDMEVEGTHTFVADGVVVHNCIGAYVAQACGAWPVVVPRGALTQSVVFGWKVDQAQFVDAVVEAMHAEEGRQRMADFIRKAGTWDGVAAMWESLWRGLA